MSKQGLGQGCFTLREGDIWNKLLVKVTEVQFHRDKGIPKSVSGREDWRIGWKKQVGWIKLNCARTGMSEHMNLFSLCNSALLFAFFALSAHNINLIMSFNSFTSMKFLCAIQSPVHQWILPGAFRHSGSVQWCVLHMQEVWSKWQTTKVRFFSPKYNISMLNRCSLCSNWSGKGIS